MAVFDGRQLARLDTGDALGDISPPFLLEGQPAIVESRLDGTHLVRWAGGGWKKDRALSGVDNVCCIQVLAAGDEVTVFRSKGESLYARGLYDAEAPWTVVASRPSGWRAFIRNGRPAVAVVNSTEGLRILEPEGGRWRVIQTADEGRGFPREVAVFQGEPGGVLTVPSSGFPGSMRVRHWDDTRLVREQRFGGSSPFPREMSFQPGGPVRFFAFMAAGFAWTFVAFLLFSLTEGLWGATPGKWLTGIRVIGTDLRLCGIGRALIRNLLKLVDGFFNFLIGILMVAYTPDWQRLGDLAARTIVIRAPAGGLRALRG